MTILDTLKSLLGLESRDRRPESDEEIGVTVEREVGEQPDASTERSVKGVGESEVEETATAETTASGKPEESGVRDEGAAGATEEIEQAEVAETTDVAEEVEEVGEVEAAEESEEVEAAEEPEEIEAAEEPEEIEEAEEPGEADTGAGTDESPDVLEGIGPAYADRLADAGVETVADLAAADASTLAEEADVSESRLERWIERAKNR